ncbi:hypothetical protein BKI52_11790 [marine bacterium AO1-C]|nr:hypothetical protein BKI52_11790 [marine bacterium AO1-C]
MRKYFISYICIFSLLVGIRQLASAQNLSFEKVPKNTHGLVSSAESSLAFADINGDKSPDLLISSYNGEDCSIQLYQNNGSGKFTKVNHAPFAQLSRSKVVFADVDGDQDQDVLLIGFDRKTFGGVTKLYINQGQGRFVEDKNVALQGVDFGAAAFADVDNDQDQDLLLTGINQQMSPVALLYLNDGKGRFQAVNTSIAGVLRGAVAFRDVNGDQLPDLLVTGGNAAYQPTAQLYINQNYGHFKAVKNQIFIGLQRSSAAFADIDGDQDADVLITGLDKQGKTQSILYENDGLGDFRPVQTTSLKGVKDGAIAFGDVDGDQDLDILITGIGQDGKATTMLYKNQGNKQFELLPQASFSGVGAGAVAFADVDQDKDLDIMITGKSTQQLGTAQLYKNGLDFKQINQPLKRLPESQLKVYPNPSYGQVFLEATDFTGSYQLLDLNGKQISTGKIDPATKITFSLKKANQIYLLNIQDAQGQKYTYKVMRK